MEDCTEQIQSAYKKGEERGWRRGLSWAGIIAAMSVLALLIVQLIFMKFFRA